MRGCGIQPSSCIVYDKEAWCEKYLDIISPASSLQIFSVCLAKGVSLKIPFFDLL